VTVAFYIAAALAVAATLLAVTRRNAVHALVYFIGSLLATGVMFFTLGAPFAAALVVLVNAGAIMVLFVFVVMMVRRGPEGVEEERRWTAPRVWRGPGILAAVLAVEFICVISFGRGAPGSAVVEPQRVGLALFGTYVLGIELVSMVLLAGLIGAHHLSRARGAARAGGRED
jgi:NADH-quinone oxidoreductase subunit J